MKRILSSGLLVLLLIGSVQAAVIDRVTIASPDSGVVRGIDSVLVVEAVLRVTAPDSGLTVFFWLVESGVDSLVLADTTTFGASSSVTDSIKAAIGASAGHFASRAPTSFIAARRARQASLTPVIGDGDWISFAIKPNDTSLADSLVFTWHCKIPASTGTFDHVQAAVVVHDPSTPIPFTPIMVSPADKSIRVDGDRPSQGSMALDSVTTGGGSSISGFSATPTRTVLGIGDTVKIAYDLSSSADAVILLGQLDMVTRVFDKEFFPPKPTAAKGVFDLVLEAGDFGDLADPASVNSDTIAFHLVDKAGNLSSTGVDDAVPTGIQQAVTFVIDTEAPQLDGQVASGDTLLPADDDTLTDGSLNDGFSDDDRPLVFNLTEGLDSLVVRFDGETDATMVLKSGLKLDNFSLRRANGPANSRRIDFTSLGKTDTTDTIRVASLDGATQELFSGATGNARVDRQGDSLRTGLYTLTFQATDLAGNVGPELTRTGVFLDVDDVDLVRLAPSTASGQDTLNASIARVSFRLSEPADSVLIAYKGIGGPADGTELTRSLTETERVNTTGRQEFELEGLVDGSRYTLSVLVRDRVGNFARSGPDTFAYDTSFMPPSIARFAVAASKAGLGSPALAGEEMTLTIQVLDSDGRTVVNHDADAVLSFVGRSAGVGVAAVTAGGKSPEIVDQGNGRILLGREGWVLGQRSVVFVDTTAVDTLQISVADSSDPGAPHLGSLDSVIVVEPDTFSRILVTAPDAVVQGEAFQVDVTLADRFGNRRTRDDRFVSVSADKLGIEIPPGDLFIEDGRGTFQARSAAWSGEGLVFLVKNLLVPGSVPGSLGTGGHYIVSRSNSVTVTPEVDLPLPTLDRPDTLVAQDYMGADGKGDQGGFLLLSFDLSEDHETLTAYRIWREIQVTHRAATPEDEIDAGLVALEPPVMKFIPWALIDPVPGVEGSMEAVVASLDTVATRWGISAERERETTAGKQAFDGYRLPAYPYELMARTMQQSRVIGRAQDPVLARPTPEALAWGEAGVVPRLKKVALLSSAVTHSVAAVGGVDNIAPEPVPHLRAFDTPNDGGGSISLQWTPSPADRLLSQTPVAGGSTFTSSGVQSYCIFRRTEGEAERLVGTAGPRATSFVDATTFNGVAYTYSVRPGDGRNAGSAGPEGTATAIRNRVFGADGEPILGLLAQNSRVDFDDFFALADRFGLTVADPQFESAFDLSPNNRIGFDDFEVLGAFFGREIPAADSAVPPREGANASARLQLVAAGETPRVGEEFGVDLRLTDLVAVQGYGFQVRYPAGEFEFVRVLSQGDGLGEGALGRPFVVVQKPGEVVVGAHGRPLAAEEIALSLVFRASREIEEGRVAIVDAQLRDVRSRLNGPALPAPLQVQTLPSAYGLQANWPNPFNPETTIRYQLPRVADVELEIYNTSGQRVRTLVDGRLNAGRYEVRWNGLDDQGRPLASGLYFYRLQAGSEFQQIRKMLLVK